MAKNYINRLQLALDSNNLDKIKNKDFVNKSFVAATPQIHYIGSADKIVTRSMTERYITNLYNKKSIKTSNF